MGASKELKRYHGNCHCGLFRFSITTPDLNGASIRTCNCSICIKNAYLWIYPIREENLTLEGDTSVEEAMSLYEFGSKDMSHYFCPNCGSSVMGRRKSKISGSGGGIGINARMLRDFDFTSLETSIFPGDDLDPKYVSPPFPSPASLGELKDGEKIYNGNCHCGAVTYTVKTKDLDETKVMRCNCSLCSRNGDHFIYPPRSSVVMTGEENLTGYALRSADSLHAFCKKCGVSVCVLVTVPGEDEMPINVRTMDGVVLERLTFQDYDGANSGPVYEGKQHKISEG